MRCFGLVIDGRAQATRHSPARVGRDACCWCVNAHHDVVDFTLPDIPGQRSVELPDRHERADPRGTAGVRFRRCVSGDGPLAAAVRAAAARRDASGSSSAWKKRSRTKCRPEARVEQRRAEARINGRPASTGYHASLCTSDRRRREPPSFSTLPFHSRMNAALIERRAASGDMIFARTRARRELGSARAHLGVHRRVLQVSVGRCCAFSAADDAPTFVESRPIIKSAAERIGALFIRAAAASDRRSGYRASCRRCCRGRATAAAVVPVVRAVAEVEAAAVVVAVVETAVVVRAGHRQALRARSRDRVPCDSASPSNTPVSSPPMPPPNPPPPCWMITGGCCLLRRIRRLGRIRPLLAASEALGFLRIRPTASRAACARAAFGSGRPSARAFRLST